MDWKGGSLPLDGKKSWFAVRVRSKCEKLAAADLQAKGIEVFAAVTRQRRVWCDRIRMVEMPLFPGYTFARFGRCEKRTVEDAAGVAGVVGFGGEICAVDESEIASLRTLAASGMDVQRSPFLRAGARTQITHGPLKGIEGLLVQQKAGFRLVVAVSILQRSVEVEVDEAFVEALPARSGDPAYPMAEAAIGA